MKRTLGYLKPYAGRTALALVTKTAGSISELVLPYLLSYIIDELTPRKDVTAIWIAGAAMLFFSLLALFGNIVANRLSAVVAGSMTRALRHDLFRKTSYLKCRQVDELTVPSLISRLTSDTYYVNQMVARTMRMGVRAPILLAGGLLFCFLLHAKLALVLVAVIPVVAVPLFFITRKSVPMYLSVQRNGDRMVRTVQEDITGIRVIKALSRTEHESEKFGGVASDLASSEFRAQRVMSLTNPLTSLILNLGLVAVIVAGAFLSAEAGDITGFLTYFIIVLNAMLGISRIFVILSRGTASAERIEKVLALDEREQVEEHPAGDPAYAVEQEQAVEGVGSVRVCLKMRHGLVREVHLAGDFFMLKSPDAELSRRLRGKKPEEAATALQGMDVPEYIANLTAMQLADIIKNCNA